MNLRRVERERRQSRPSGGVSATLAKRTGRGDRTPKSVVSFFGEPGDTPMIDMLKATTPNADRFREGDHVHVSDVIKRCMRRIAIMQRMNMRHPQETVYDGRGITYAIGEAVHDYVKARFIKGHPEKVWAKWSCPCGETTCTGTFATRKYKKCEVCEKPVAKHNEVSFIYEKFKLKGTPDLLLWLKEYDAFLVTELKSMAAEQFKLLERPEPDHVVQISLYWHILKAAGYAVVDMVSILYVNKEFSFKLPYREFLIDPQAVDLTPYWDDLEALKRALEGGKLPPRVMCGTESAPEAKKCPVCVTCFGSK